MKIKYALDNRSLSKTKNDLWPRWHLCDSVLPQSTMCVLSSCQFFHTWKIPQWDEGYIFFWWCISLGPAKDREHLGILEKWSNSMKESGLMYRWEEQRLTLLVWCSGEKKWEDDIESWKISAWSTWEGKKVPSVWSRGLPSGSWFTFSHWKTDHDWHKEDNYRILVPRIRRSVGCA